MTEFWVSRRYPGREASLEQAKAWTDSEMETQQKVPVVYYLSRNGQLEHPHFIEVPLSSPQGLYLRDVINRLNSLRGQGMGNLYAWSSKRSYRNGYVWQDLSENDFIYPSHGREYILKGSQLLQTSMSSRSYETVSSSTSKNSSDISGFSEDSSYSAINGRKSHSRSAFNELNAYKVYEANAMGEATSKSTNASTQTEEKKRQREACREEFAEQEGHGIVAELISPSYGSSETGGSADIRDQTAGNDRPSGRMKATEVFIQMIACGSRRVRDDESVMIKD